MQNMYAREALISALPKVDFFLVKVVQLYFDIWTRLETFCEGDKHAN